GRDLPAYRSPRSIRAGVVDRGDVVGSCPLHLASWSRLTDCKVADARANGGLRRISGEWVASSSLASFFLFSVAPSLNSLPCKVAVPRIFRRRLRIQLPV